MTQQSSRRMKRKAQGSGRKIFLSKNVWEAGMERIERIFDEFPEVVVHVSGGKDSTVLLHMALEVAAAKGRLPLKIFWLDQEVEWQATVDMVTSWMERDDVDPYWLQIPFRLGNSTAKGTQWFQVWDPEKEGEWMREKHPLAIHENELGTDRFKELFDRSMGVYCDGPVAALTGVRTEESPGRLLGLTSNLTYKDITWGRIVNKSKGHYVFCPIYDWSFRDIWKAIHDHGWDYNPIYDEQYRYGVPVRDMRISALQHETATKALFLLQEFEPETYERMVERVEGVSAATAIGTETFTVPQDLPPMFDSWYEYRDHLAEHLLDDYAKGKLTAAFKSDERYCPEFLEREMCRTHIRAILTHDSELTSLRNWRNWRASREVRLAMLDEQKRQEAEGE